MFKQLFQRETVGRRGRAAPLARLRRHYLEHCAERGLAPSLAGEIMDPHVIRHTTVTHLLRAGVDMHPIRDMGACCKSATSGIRRLLLPSAGS